MIKRSVRPCSEGFDFHRALNDGNVSRSRVPTRVYTVGLHRPNPVALEMPGFIGFFTRPRWLAEREGFSATLRNSRVDPRGLVGVSDLKDRTSKRPSSVERNRPIFLPIGGDFSVETAAKRW